ncbi:MAG: hypothetical protein LC121_20565 [Anaerolineae bacterium]|nr:hypothetical protein [Anaerolineae bacterium]
MIVALLATVFTVFPYRVDGDAVDPVSFFHGFASEALIAICVYDGQPGLVNTGALAGRQ